MIAPLPYKFCENHFKANCPICSPSQAQPTPVNDEPIKPVQGANKPGDQSLPPEHRGMNDISPALAVAPAFSDPTAMRVVETAQNYARAIEAVTLITEQVRETRELLVALETKLKETKEIADAAQNELRNVTVQK